MIDTGLKHKVALITGINNPYGIGAATAKALAAEGAAVFGTYLRTPTTAGLSDTPGEEFYRAESAKTADDVVTDIRQRGGKIEAWEADLAEPSILPQLFDRAEKAFGPVDVLINNAAHGDADTFIPQSQLGGDARAVDGSSMTTITAGTHDKHFAEQPRSCSPDG